MIKIPKIELEYPILEQTTKATMKISISRFWGGAINSYGNVSLAGHNNIGGTMFGKNKYLELGDKVYLTDLSNSTVEYEIYDIFVTDPNDVTILQTEDTSVREVTLITCTNGRANRLIIKAKEII
jgi:LPXTG-site transpeptidase (sortase) family protein